jgi:hypothetical protein
MKLEKTATKTSLALAIALTAGLGLSACSTGEDTAAAADSGSSTVDVPDAVATVPAVAGGTTAVALDADFVAALETLGVTPGTVGSATLADGSVAFPITGGTVTLYDRETGYRPWVQGVLLHEGSGLSLAAGGTTVELTDFTISPGKPARLFGTVSVDGQVAVPSAPLFDLDGSTLEPPTMDGTDAILDGTTVELSPEAAELLNSTFDIDALDGGLVIGTSTITVETE